MKEVLTTFMQEHFYQTALLIFLCFLGIIISMVVDLIAGVRKARELGRARTSTGYKKSCAKAIKYFCPFFVAVCIDIITCVVIPVPTFSMLWACWVMFCEFKSVREKAWEKEEIRQQNKTMKVILENKDDIIKSVAKMIREEIKEEKEDGNSN